MAKKRKHRNDVTRRRGAAPLRFSGNARPRHRRGAGPNPFALAAEGLERSLMQGTIMGMAFGAAQGAVRGILDGSARRTETLKRVLLIRDGLDRIKLLAHGDEPKRMDKIIAKASEVDVIVAAWLEELKKEKATSDNVAAATAGDPGRSDVSSEERDDGASGEARGSGGDA